MSIRNFRRFVSEAASGLVKNGLVTVASLFVVTSCLFIFGVFMAVSMNISYLGEQMQNECQIQVYITSEAKYGGKIQKISNTIKKLDNVSGISYESGEVTLENFKKGLDKDELAAFEGLPNDVISDSFKITLKDIAHSEDIAKKVAGIDGVERVENRQDLITMVNNLTQLIQKVSIWILVLFAIISLFIISNTIKLSVHNRGKEINIMKYVGATDSYIRGPFMIEGIMTGLISAVIAFFISWFVYSSALGAVSNSASLSAILKLLEFKDIYTALIVAYVLLGAAIGAFGSGISIRRYLKV